MKALTATLLATAFLAVPAYACGFKDMAKHDTSITASVTPKPETAMSTFDPKSPLVFEEKEEANAKPAEDAKKEVTSD